MHAPIKNVLCVCLFVCFVISAMFSVPVTAVAQTCSTPSFAQPPIYAAGSDTRGMASADFDGDGHADLAIVDVDSDSLTVYSKLAQTIPVVTNSYTVGRFPLAVAAGDFNGDGKPDLITANNSSFDLTLLLNDGTGLFTHTNLIPAQGTPQALALGDFNNDTKLDVAVVNSSSQNITILLGDGQGGFGAPHSFNAGGPQQVTTADFNGDGKLDLAVTTFSNVKILFGNGTGAFALDNSGTCPIPAGGIGIAAGDLNGDSKPDLVIANLLGGQIIVLLNDGSGHFCGVVPINGIGPRYVTLSDLNGDAKLDIIGDTTVLLGNGSGGFGPAITYGTGSASTPGANTVTGDFDGDGKLDIASVGGGSLSLLLGDGAGRIKNAAGPAGRGVFGAALGDMNSDNKPDLVYFNTASANLMLSDGTGSFSTPLVFPLNSFLESPVVGDFNGDTKLDVAGLDSSNNGAGGTQRLMVLAGDGAGVLASPIETNFSGQQPRTLAGGDFNGDGKLDLLTLNLGGGPNGSISVFLGDGAGHFGAPTLFPVGISVNPKQVGVADLNGDGKLDLAIPSGFGFSILIGNGSGGFGPATQITTANSQSIVVADFNGDTKPDLAMVNGEQNSKLSVVLGDGSGSFGPPTQFDVGTFPSDLVAADFNGDGKFDIAVASPNTSPNLAKVVVLFGNGAGNFSSRTDYLVERSPNRILSGDFNNDGRIDLVTANQGPNNFSVLINTCGSAVAATPSVQFSAPIFSVDEGAQTAIVTVTRTGDLTNEASVKYATSDGIASSTSDYIAAFGRLHFGPGESSKSITVLIIDDLRAGEESESFNIKLSSPAGATLGSTSSAVVAIQDNDPTITNVNPIDSAEFFVRQHYFDFLNRVPDAPGLAFWVDQMTHCGSADPLVCRINVSAAFFLSIEFQRTGYLVYRTYKTAYGDAASPNVAGTVPIVKLNEFLTDSHQLGENVIVGTQGWEQQLETNTVAYMRQFVNEPRFLNAFPLNMTPAEFVDKLNTNAGGVLTQLERDQLIMQLTGAPDATTGRATALRQVADNELLKQRELNRAFVLMQYFGYLRRNPNDPQDVDFSGWKFWLDKLNQFNGDFVAAEMVKAFITSAEYRNRFNSPTGF